MNSQLPRASSSPSTDLDPGLSIYRDACVALLRKYFSLSMGLGRLPALLGREFFRSRVRCRVTSFEDVVIFVHDIDRCLQRLHPFDQKLIARCVLQEYTRDEAAKLLRCTRRTVQNRLPEAIDAVTAMLLRHRLLKMPARRPARPAAPPAPSRTPDPAPLHPSPPSCATPPPCGIFLVKPPAEAVSP